METIKKRKYGEKEIKSVFDKLELSNQEERDKYLKWYNRPLKNNERIIFKTTD
jgi:hypothetical protein